MRNARVTGIVCLLVGAAVGAGLIWLIDPRGRPGAKPDAKPVDPVDRPGLQVLRDTLGNAFHHRDAKRVAGMYAEDAELIEFDGETFKGRAAIEKHFADLIDPGTGPFAKSFRVTATMTNERFVTPEVVIEDGTWQSNATDKGIPNRGRYVIVAVHRDGQWRVISHRSWVPVAAPVPSKE
jgi:uncharacterized protein (TIGR02246 family)